MSDDMLHQNRALRELLDRARTVIEDGVVTEEEAEAFNAWVSRNPDVLPVGRARLLTSHLRRIFADGRVAPEEREELLELLRDLTGELSAVPPWEWGKLEEGRS